MPALRRQGAHFAHFMVRYRADRGRAMTIANEPQPEKVVEFDFSKFWAGFGEFIAVVIFLVWLAVWRGFAIVCSWHWLIVPTFRSAPELSIPAAIGIAFL